MAAVAKDIFPVTPSYTSSPQVALDQTAPISFHVVLLNFFVRFVF